MMALEELQEMSQRSDGAESSQDIQDEEADGCLPASCPEESEIATDKESNEPKDAIYKADSVKTKVYELEKQRIDRMSGPEAVEVSCAKIMNQAEQLTQREMKTCVAEYISARCQGDPELARLVAHPRKNLIHCIHSINRRAMEYLKEQAKLERECRGEKENLLVSALGNSTALGGSVPDGLCYEWAEAYFRNSNAEEDMEAKPVKKTPPVTKASKNRARVTQKAQSPAQAVQRAAAGEQKADEDEEYQMHL